MSLFQKLSNRRLIILPIITLELYFVAWFIDTSRALNKAGGKINNILLCFAIPEIFIFWPNISMFFLNFLTLFFKKTMLNVFSSSFATHPNYANFLNYAFYSFPFILCFYFLYKYTQTYVELVKKTNNRTTFKYYFAIALLPLMFSICTIVMAEWYGYNFAKEAISSNYNLSKISINYSVLSIKIIYAVILYIVNLTRMMIFQKGFNEYAD
jgi:hypothetical protein